MLYITVPDMNDSVSSVVIDKKEYNLRFTWNGTHEYWSFGVLDTDMHPLLAGVKVVPRWPLNHSYPAAGLPEGTFGVISDKDTVGRDDFTDGKAVFVYIPDSDIVEAK